MENNDETRRHAFDPSRKQSRRQPDYAYDIYDYYAMGADDQMPACSISSNKVDLCLRNKYLFTSGHFACRDQGKKGAVGIKLYPSTPFFRPLRPFFIVPFYLLVTGGWAR
jgi:hypothetical protein